MSMIARRTLLLACMAPMLGAPAVGHTQTLPSELTQALPGAGLLGQMRFRYWGFDVYDASLWALPGFGAAAFDAHPVALELRYLRDFDLADIADRSLKEMRRLATPSAEQEQRWRAEIQRVLSSVKKGDRLLGLHRPGQGATFWLNGQARGDIRDAEFARLFFGIWLSPRTSEPALRQALLGKAAP